MVKVLSQGTKYSRETKEVTCGRCESVLSVSESDIRPDDRDGAYVECPVCKQFIAAKVIWP